MATVYKIEIILTSDWINYSEEKMKALIELTLSDSKVDEIQTLSDIEIKVTKIA